MHDFRKANLCFLRNRLCRSLSVLMMRDVDRVGQAIYLFMWGSRIWNPSVILPDGNACTEGGFWKYPGRCKRICESDERIQSVLVFGGIGSR